MFAAIVQARYAARPASHPSHVPWLQASDTIYIGLGYTDRIPAIALDERLSILGGLRYVQLDTDYRDGKGAQTFEYAMAISGPAVAMVFTF